MLNYLLASRSLELVRSEEQVRADQVNILERILSSGEIPRLDVDLARIEFSKTEVAMRAAEGQTANAYMRIDPSTEAGRGIAAEAMQFHGIATQL